MGCYYIHPRSHLHAHIHTYSGIRILTRRSVYRRLMLKLNRSAHALACDCGKVLAFAAKSGIAIIGCMGELSSYLLMVVESCSQNSVSKPVFGTALWFRHRV